MEKLVLIDGHNMLFRLFFGMQWSMQHEDGRDVKCAVGFASSINKLVKEFETNKLLVLFDSITSTGSRLEIYPEYKQNRVDYSQVEPEDNPFNQLADVYKTLDLLDIGYIEAHGYEADDYIATICKKYKDQYEIVIVSTDSDFNQLISEHISIFKPRGQKSMMLTPEVIKEQLNVTPDQIIEYKSLIGDTADNIPGIKGIGPKRAAEILSYGTLDQIISGSTDIPEKYLNKIIEHKDILIRNKLLIQMVLDVPVEINDTQISVSFDSFFKAKSIIKHI